MKSVTGNPNPSAASEVVLGPATVLLIGHARAGNPTALSDVYGVAAALVAAGAPVPEPLATFIGERLRAISAHFRSAGDDLSKGALAAIVGSSKRGPKRKAAPLMRYSQEENAQAAAVDIEYRRVGNLEKAVGNVAARLGVPEETIAKADKKAGVKKKIKRRP